MSHNESWLLRWVIITDVHHVIDNVVDCCAFAVVGDFAGCLDEPAVKDGHDNAFVEFDLKFDLRLTQVGPWVLPWQGRRREHFGFD